MAILPARLRPPFLRLTLFLLLASLLRLTLALTHLTQLERPFGQTAHAMFYGLRFDLWVALLVVLPHFLWALLTPQQTTLTRWRLWRYRLSEFLFWFLLLYIALVEYFFFDEFDARFNFVAVDYLLFPHEVFVNVWESYPIVRALTITAVIALVLTRFSLPYVVQAKQSAWSWSRRLSLIALYGVGTIVLGSYLSLSEARISSNRVVNELALNGYFSFAHALRTNELDYDQFYAHLNEDEAYQRVRNKLLLKGESWVGHDTHSITRHIPGASRAPQKNVVLILEESFGSEFSKLLHPEQPRDSTPAFDALAQNGLLFTHLYATGNRTVRGMEAVLTSFIPIPGQSIVKRPGSDSLFSLPSVFRSLGYQTRFIYGGYGYFDNMASFALHNGFERVVDQTQFSDHEISFTTSWGVCDEDLFNRSLRELDQMQRDGKPFFTTILTVSNHKPYLYPAGRIDEDPAQQKRRHAVRYADFALGQFIEQARRHAFFNDTVFVILGDHGARVYGEQDIPLPSYEIPLLIYSPGAIAAQRDDRLASQLDVAPTLLGVLNADYNSQFFGRDLRRVPDQQRYAFLSHNRDVAMLQNNHLSVLSMQNQQRLWQVLRQDGHTIALDLDRDKELVNDTVAFYQVAYHQFSEKKLHPLPLDHRALNPHHASN